MQSDKQLYKLFTVAPAELYILLGLPAPGPVTARSEVYKALETSTDLAVEPLDDVEPAMIVEFQGYLSEQFIAKVMLRCALYCLQHSARAIRCHVIYLNRKFESPAVDDDGMFRPRVHYLPDLVQRLEDMFPESPLLSVLRPLVVEDPQELTELAATDYQRISETPALTTEQRAIWLQVFYVWLMIRLQNSLEEVSKMVIAGLPAVEETPWGKELKERWISEGRQEGQKEGQKEGQREGQKVGNRKGRAEELKRQLRTLEEMLSAGELPEPAYRRLKDYAEQELRNLQAELDRLQNGPKTHDGPGS